MLQEMPRDFKGIWIPREIWMHPELSSLDKILWAEIHSLYCPEKKGCYASNEYLYNFLGVKERQLQNILCHLKSLGLIVEVSFNGRGLIRKAIDPTLAEVQKNAPQRCNDEGCNLLHPSPAINCTPLIETDLESGREKKRDKIKKVSKDTQKDPKIKVRDNVLLLPKEYQTLIDAHGKDFVELMLDTLSAYKGSHGKEYKSDYATMCKGGWVLKQTMKDSPPERADDASMEYFRKVAAKMAEIGRDQQVVLGHNYIEFISGSHVIDHIKCHDPSQKERVKGCLRKLGVMH